MGDRRFSAVLGMGIINWMVVVAIALIYGGVLYQSRFDEQRLRQEARRQMETGSAMAPLVVESAPTGLPANDHGP